MIKVIGFEDKPIMRIILHKYKDCDNKRSEIDDYIS